ncbi:uncharacterized protein A4U43_C05F8610 [Asparagus officinalis]|uniref:Uncharacterized protein n=1 Tax=Asparagus officinalis TaxID=4686 RepID=A0A5P1ERB3_ASPOF|nr:uncharacterized protein A4U43_C05F8610 [Asparagus officinalis]
MPSHPSPLISIISRLLLCLDIRLEVLNPLHRKAQVMMRMVQILLETFYLLLSLNKVTPPYSGQQLGHLPGVPVSRCLLSKHEEELTGLLKSTKQLSLHECPSDKVVSKSLMQTNIKHSTSQNLVSREEEILDRMSLVRSGLLD